LPILGKKEKKWAPTPRKPRRSPWVDKVDKTKNILLNKIPEKLFIDSIYSPEIVTNEDKKIEVITAPSPITKYFVADARMLNTYLPNIKQLFKTEKFNFTSYKANLWQEEIKVSEAIAYELALLIPDIASPPFYDLGFAEHPHLGIYLWGIAGGLRTTIGRILGQQWLYSFILSDTGFDSDVGIIWALSQANRDLLLIGADIGSATKGLKDWQRKVPATVVNFVWDGREVRTTKGEGTLIAENKGVSFYGGGNNPLGQSEFTVKDVSRIIQNQMPSTKGRPLALMAKRLKRKAKLSRLASPVILYTHYLNALIMKERVKTGFFNGKTVTIDISEALRKKIGAHIFKHYIPKLVSMLSDDEIWDKMEEFQSKAEDMPEDTNAILRVLTIAYMIVRDGAIDNLLLRPYSVKDNVIHIETTEEDLIPFYAILDRNFWVMKREEFKFARIYKEITPAYLRPHLYYYELLKQVKVTMTPTSLYNHAKSKLIKEGKLTQEEFNKIYGEKDRLMDNYKLQRAIEELAKMSDIAKIDGKPVQYCIVQESKDVKTPFSTPKQRQP